MLRPVWSMLARRASSTAPGRTGSPFATPLDDQANGENRSTDPVEILKRRREADRKTRQEDMTALLREKTMNEVAQSRSGVRPEMIGHVLAEEKNPAVDLRGPREEEDKDGAESGGPQGGEKLPACRRVTQLARPRDRCVASQAWNRPGLGIGRDEDGHTTFEWNKMGLGWGRNVVTYRADLVQWARRSVACSSRLFHATRGKYWERTQLSSLPFVSLLTSPHFSHLLISLLQCSSLGFRLSSVIQSGYTPGTSTATRKVAGYIIGVSLNLFE